MRRQGASIYSRERGDVQRTCADLRAYAGVGGRRESLMEYRVEQHAATLGDRVAALRGTAV